MKVAIVYVSVHHKNTEKIVKAMAEVVNADLFNLTKSSDIDLSKYEIVGLASGIYAGNMHKSIIKFIESAKLPNSAFLVCTCGMPIVEYTKKVKKILDDKGIKTVDSFECKAFNNLAHLH